MERILTDYEVTELLPEAIKRRADFLKLVKTSIKNSYKTASNLIILEGKPGTGKSTLINQALDSLKDEGLIYDFHVFKGHLTKTSVFNLMRPDDKAEGKLSVHVFDDADVLRDNDILELLKAAFETRNLAQAKTHPDFRRVSYNTKGMLDSYVYNGYGIVITNQAPNQTENIHYKALFDRAIPLKIEFGEDDLFVFNMSIVQDILEKNIAGWSDEDIENITHFFKTKIRQWWTSKAFANANIEFSIRRLMTFMDVISSFGLDFWCKFFPDYERLEKASK